MSFCMCAMWRYWLSTMELCLVLYSGCLQASDDWWRRKTGAGRVQHAAWSPRLDPLHNVCVSAGGSYPWWRRAACQWSRGGRYCTGAARCSPPHQEPEPLRCSPGTYRASTHRYTRTHPHIRTDPFQIHNFFLLQDLVASWSDSAPNEAHGTEHLCVCVSHTWRASVWACGWRWRPVAPSRWTESAAPGWRRWSEWSSQCLLQFQLHSSCSTTVKQRHTINGTAAEGVALKCLYGINCLDSRLAATTQERERSALCASSQCSFNHKNTTNVCFCVEKCPYTSVFDNSGKIQWMDKSWSIDQNRNDVYLLFYNVDHSSEQRQN